jgi:hypothetical protein
MKSEEVEDFIRILENEYKAGLLPKAIIYRTKLEIETAESEHRSAVASERNAKYMLWSVVAAAVSAIASLISTVIVVFGHH